MAPHDVHSQREVLRLLNVREAAERVTAGFAGAVRIPMDRLRSRLRELDRTTPVAVLPGG